MRKRYALHDSPFFKLKGKGQLERLLGASLEDVENLSAASSYRAWVEDDREIQAPKGKLAAIHKRIAILLKRIELPGYVYSRKGRSHIDNAAQHVGDIPLIKTDIRKFYPSTSREMVLRMFRDDFLCAGDIAHILADLCCFDRRHLPTGSPISGYIASLAARPMFDRIQSIAVEEGCVMSTFVDDIAISGHAADLFLLLRVRRELRRSGFKTSNRKSMAYGARQPKKLTGTIITPTGLCLPNRQYKKIRMTRQALGAARSSGERNSLSARLRGQLDAASQVLRHPRAAPRLI
jgi:hypothetical protein